MKPRVPALLFLALAGAATLTPEALAAAPRYRMVMDATQAEQGVKTVSLVKNPAIQRGWVALSAVEATAPKAQLFHLSSAGQRQVVTGPALIPGQQILRLDAEGNPFYITFDEENIAATQRQYAKQLRHTSTNEDHATDLEGNVVEESWIIEDATCDKAVALGLADLPKGTWMLSLHVPDSEYWQNEIVSGNKLGFSIEGLFTTEQLTLSAVPAPTTVKKNWVTALWAALTGLGNTEASAVRVALGLEKLADGRTVSIDETTGAVLLVGEDGQPGEALPDGEYDLEGGGKLVVKDGVKAATEVDAAKEPGADGPATPPTPGADTPAAGTDAERLDKVEKQVAEILTIVKELKPTAPDPTTEPAAPKLAAQLHGVSLAAVAEKLTELKLDAVELEGGDTLTLNPVSRRLSNADGSLVESGYFAAADGSYFCVSTDQYFYQIDKQTYDKVYGAKLQEVELADLKSKTPAAGRVRLNGETGPGAAAEGGTKTQKLGLSVTARLREMQGAE
jgi:hypothetical protein